LAGPPFVWEPAVGGGDILKVLSLLAADSRVYSLQLEEARIVVERLSDDIDDVTVNLLLTSITTALGEPPRLGTPRHVERLAAALVRKLS
jgi:hypothetical protein